MTINFLTKEFLTDHYITQGKSFHEIGEEFDISYTSVGNAMKRHNLFKRTGGTRKGKPNKHPGNTVTTDLINQKFGLLTVIKYVHGGWLCQCDCGKTKICRTARLTSGFVKSCGCLKTINGQKHTLWKGCGDISGRIYQGYKHGAIRRDLSFDISVEDMWFTYEQQGGICTISKIPISFKKDDITASLDRIDSSKGYTKNNIQWLHKTVNQMKWDSSQEDFIKWCHLISNNNS